MGASTYLDKQAFVEDIYDSAVEAGNSFLNAIKAARRAARTAISGGTVLIEHSANGHDWTKEVLGQFDPMEALRLLQEIRNRYSEARAKLIADGNETPTDGQIKDEMLDKIRPIRGYVNDFSGGRIEIFSEEEDD